MIKLLMKQVKERYKGPRTKYYVLKNFSSTAEVFLKLLEESLQRQARNPWTITRALTRTLIPGR